MSPVHQDHVRFWSHPLESLKNFPGFVSQNPAVPVCYFTYELLREVVSELWWKLRPQEKSQHGKKLCNSYFYTVKCFVYLQSSQDVKVTNHLQKQTGNSLSWNINLPAKNTNRGGTLMWQRCSQEMQAEGITSLEVWENSARSGSSCSGTGIHITPPATSQDCFFLRNTFDKEWRKKIYWSIQGGGRTESIIIGMGQLENIAIYQFPMVITPVFIMTEVCGR